MHALKRQKEEERKRIDVARVCVAVLLPVIDRYEVRGIQEW